MNKEHKCKINFELGCGNACCKYCLGIDECDWACHGNPESCGLTKDTDSDQQWE